MTAKETVCPCGHARVRRRMDPWSESGLWLCVCTCADCGRTWTESVDAANLAKFLTPDRTRAILEAATMLHELGDDRRGAVDLVLGIRCAGWDVRTWARFRRELARRLAARRWSESQIVEAIHSDRRTVAKWLAGEV